jgi:hypothetical protein
LKAVADAVAEVAAQTPTQALIPAHLALIRMKAGDVEGARAAALQAEKNGFVGRNALPNPALLEVFGIKAPASVASDR